MLSDLVRHKAFANAALLHAIQAHQPAANDSELLKLLHHILLANRFWFLLILGEPFAAEQESRLLDSLAGLAVRYRETSQRELDWALRINHDELARLLETPHLPGRHIPVGEAMLQVCLHSVGHRAQAATRLRELGGTPPPMDYILWSKDRQNADWS